MDRRWLGMAKKPSPEKPAPLSLLPGFQHLIPTAAAAPLAAHMRPLFLPDLVQQIVCDYAEIRRYSRQKSSNHVHRVLLTELDGPDRLAEFYAIFHADSLLGTCTFAQNTGWLLRETDKRQEKVSVELYREYAECRVELIQELRARA
jgi:hypothetical protein